MKTLIERFVGGLGRFVFGLGIGLALTSAYVIVAGGGDALSFKPAASDVVRLEPITVTISAERFAVVQRGGDEAVVHVDATGPRPA